MSRSSNKRYRSYREKKSQTKRFRIYFIRIFILLIFYSLFTIFIAISVGVNSNSMSPNIVAGDRIVMLPTKNLNALLQKKSNKVFRRGEVIISNTNYAVKTSLFEIIVDPVVRIFTLQHRSLLYDNRGYKGRGELLRIVGLPGDTIRIKDSTVYIKSSEDEFFLSEFELTDIDYDIIKKNFSKNWKKEYPFSSELKDIYISDNHYFLISDNRGFMNDSRIFGIVSRDEIIGKVILKYWPINEFGIF